MISLLLTITFFVNLNFPFKVFFRYFAHRALFLLKYWKKKFLRLQKIITLDSKKVGCVPRGYKKKIE